VWATLPLLSPVLETKAVTLQPQEIQPQAQANAVGLRTMALLLLQFA
jgi:hypothetical protein